MLVAGTVLAVARALGEAIMLAMVSGSIGFAPNPADGAIFFFEPSRPLAATILQNAEELTLAADAPHAVRDRGGAAVLGRDAVVRRLGGQAADEEVRGAAHERRQPPTTAAPQIPAVERSAPWRLRDRIGLAFAGS